MRIVAISDLHGTFPESIPECDLLIVAGDLCPDRFEGRFSARNYPERQLNWFNNVFVPWAEQQPAEFVLATWGNHDFCGHLLPNAHYDKLDVVSDGPVIINGVKLWLTPWSNQFMDWAWMKPHEELGEIYGKIPYDVDILVSHQPPYNFNDLYPDPVKLAHIGSQELLYHIERVKPDVLICGHLHGGHGMDKCGETTMYNVSILNEDYQLYYPPTIIEYV